VKYVVEIAGKTVDVDIDGDKVRVDGQEVAARISDLPGTPIVLLTIEDSVYRVAASRGR
jgi:hypothetical protein